MNSEQQGLNTISSFWFCPLWIQFPYKRAQVMLLNDDRPYGERETPSSQAIVAIPGETPDT